MAMREQFVALNIKYDDEELGPPGEWAWHELIDCDPVEVQVMLAGEVVDVHPADPEEAMRLHPNQPYNPDNITRSNG